MRPTARAATLSRIAAQEQQRARELPTAEELATKDVPLDQLLSRISDAIRPHRVDVTQPGAAAVAASTSSSGTRLPAPQQSPQAPQQPQRPQGPQGGGTAVTLSAKNRVPIPLYTPSGTVRQRCSVTVPSAEQHRSSKQARVL